MASITKRKSKFAVVYWYVDEDENGNPITKGSELITAFFLEEKRTC